MYWPKRLKKQNSRVMTATLRQCIFQSEVAQLARRVRQDIDADADGLQLGCGFEDAAGNACAMQHEPERKSADAGADDQNFHCTLAENPANVSGHSVDTSSWRTPDSFSSRLGGCCTHNRICAPSRLDLSRCHDARPPLEIASDHFSEALGLPPTALMSCRASDSPHIGLPEQRVRSQC